MSSSKIELWFVRHGESKNNAILNAAGGLGAVMYPVKFSQDPLITEKGISVASANGERLLEAGVEFDLLLSSCMIRTIETSFYMFVKTKIMGKIFVVPYISEIPLSFGKIPIYENMPLKRQEQIKSLGRAHGSELLDSLDWSLVGGPNGDNEALLPPNGDNFLQWLVKNEMIRELIATKEEAGEKVRIAVVTHSHFLMKKDTLHLDKKPSNADIWIANLHITPSDGVGEDILTLTDLQGWFREEVAVKQEHIARKIEKTEQKAAKKTEKYTSKLGRLSLRFGSKSASSTSESTSADGEAQPELSEDELKALEKRNKKEEKYKHRMSKKQEKYGKKKDELQERKAMYVNPSDIQIQEMRAKAAQEAEES